MRERRTVRQMTDAELREHKARLAATPGKYAGRAYMVALNECIRREQAADPAARLTDNPES
jgi:hypothetical protein